jgi:hypothetical protein
LLIDGSAQAFSGKSYWRVEIRRLAVMQRALPLYNLLKTLGANPKGATGLTGLQKNRAINGAKKSTP